MPLTELAFALLVLLLTPGPTNTLLAVAGTERGWRGALPLIPFEVLAYLLVVVPLALAGQALLTALPVLKPVIGGMAALWVMGLAVKMWRLPEAGAAPQVTAGRVFVTTLLNPKALIVGLVLLPGAGLALRAGLFAALVVSVAAVWAALGACIAGRSDCPARQTAPLFRRIAALWLGALSVGLMLGSLPHL